MRRIVQTLGKPCPVRSPVQCKCKPCLFCHSLRAIMAFDEWATREGTLAVPWPINLVAHGIESSTRTIRSKCAPSISRETTHALWATRLTAGLSVTDECAPVTSRCEQPPFSHTHSRGSRTHVMSRSDSRFFFIAVGFSLLLASRTLTLNALANHH